MLDSVTQRADDTRAAARRDAPGPGGSADRGGGKDRAAWQSRTDLELLLDQLDAIESWHTAQRMQQETTPQPRDLSRQARLELARRRDARQRVRQALLERSPTQMAQSTRLLDRGRPRTVLVHRREWLRQKVEDELARHGIDVVAHLDNGADGIGVLVVEQPDLLLVEDALPMVRGAAVIRAARQFAGRTRVAAQVDSDVDLPGVLQAGAHVAHTRRAAPSAIGRSLAALVAAASG